MKANMLTAINISKEEAEAIIFLPADSALISIGDEHERFWNLKIDGDNVLKLAFSDVTRPVQKGSKQYTPMRRVQAKVIAEFIKKHQTKKFIVNCQAGISRSAAVCLFIHRQYGHILKPNFWKLSHPNPWVLQLLQSEGEIISQSQD